MDLKEVCRKDVGRITPAQVKVVFNMVINLVVS